MVLSLLRDVKVPASKQCGFEFIPEIGPNTGNFPAVYGWHGGDTSHKFARIVTDR